MGASEGDGENVEVLRDGGFKSGVLDFLADDGIGNGLWENPVLHQIKTHLVAVSPVRDGQDAVSRMLVDEREDAPISFVIAEVGELMIGILAEELVILYFVTVLAVDLVPAEGNDGVG